MQVIGVRDPSAQGWPIKVKILHASGESEEQEAAANLIGVMNRLGAEGWEILGAPENQNVVADLRSHDGSYRESSRWVQRRFWLKREVE